MDTEPHPASAEASAHHAPRADSTAIIEIDDLHKRYGTKPVLNGINLRVARGEAVVILGENGSGKSTLLRCINMLESYERGRVRLRGEVVSEGRPIGHHPSRAEKAAARQLRQHLGMVFQRIHLFPHMTVLQNVMCGPVRVQGRPKSQAANIAREMLDKVGLWEKHPCDPGTLSGGQQQRVAIARALAMNPDVLLFDECTSALDPLMTREVLRVIRQLAAEGRTMLVVTHDIAFARETADRIVFMEDGRITAEGTADYILNQRPTDGLQRFLKLQS